MNGKTESPVAGSHTHTHTSNVFLLMSQVSSGSEAGLHPSDADASVIINVTQDHLLRACHGLQPSVSASERRKYHRM